MKNNLLKSLLTAVLLACHLSAPAEDIDLFINATSASTAPNVLLIVDNTANWNNAFANEMAALASTLDNLNDDQLRVGIMFAAETGSPNTNTNGGYVRAAIRLMDSNNRPKYKALVNSFDKIKDKGNGGIASLVMAEAYQYFAGGTPVGGSGKVKGDYSGNTLSDSNGGTAASRGVWALPGNALNSFNGTTYNSPASQACQQFIIYISNGPSNDNSSVTQQSSNLLAAAGGDITTIPLSPSASQSNMSDEWARFMKDSKGIVTYTIDVDPGTSGQGPGWTAILKSMASVSTGKYFAVSSGNGGAQISDAIAKTLSEIQAVNSVFASVSLPVTANAQGTYVNQVYVGMFRPDATALPRWAGNLKQYKLGYDITNVFGTLDADGNNAINSSTGFITECARSFWTPTTTDSYWSFRPSGGCKPASTSSTPPVNPYLSSNFPDGNVVEKGAQGYVLRSRTDRTVKTCSPVFTSCTSLTSFDTSNTAITNSLLGLTSSSTDARTLINWARGIDTDTTASDPVSFSPDENSNGITGTEMRPSAHGDVVHSQPVAINYGTATSPSIVVYYGANDGMLRAVNGNRSASITSNGKTYAAGQELWSFVAPESYGIFKRLYENSPSVKVAGLNGGAPKQYGIDGPITAYMGSGNSSSTWLYASMRRGGRVLYSFDVTTPGNPSLKWKKGCPKNFPASGTVDDTGCTSGLAGIGQTWSAPKTLLASGYENGSSPLLIMGGGYDPCEDADPHSCSAAGYSIKGNHIYVLDANTGALKATFDTERSVVGNVFVVPDTTTGLAIYAYAADMGGNVYRITIGSAAPASWTMTKIASLGCDTATACASNRKFMFGPDVVLDNGVYMLILGSGDREKPLNSYTNAYGTTNYFFMIKDKPSDNTWLSSESTNCNGNSVICLNSLLGITTEATPSRASLDSKKGWYLGLAPHEQVVTSAVTMYGVVTFSTHQPENGTASCGSRLGTSLVYNINYSNAANPYGSGRYQQLSGGGLPPSPVAGMVTLDDDTTVPFVIGANPNSPLNAKINPPPPGTASSQPKSRVYWYIQQ